jgi:hypothetical protein
MDKFIAFLNGLFITVYVLAGMGTGFLFLFRGVNEEVGLRWLNQFAPYILGVVLFGICHAFLYNAYKNDKADKGQVS